MGVVDDGNGAEPDGPDGPDELDGAKSPGDLVAITALADAISVIGSNARANR